MRITMLVVMSITCCVLAAGNGAGNMLKDRGNYRIALDHDGQGDWDDIAALPLSLALIEYAGYTDRLVHVDICNHVWKNSCRSEMQKAMNDGIEQFDMNASIFYNAHSVYNDQGSGNNVVNNSLASEIDKSTANNPLYISASGPYEVIYRTLKQSTNKSAWNHVYIISHSSFNDKNDKGGSKTRTDVEGLGFDNIISIKDGNNNGFNEKDASYWNFLKNSSDDRLKWVYSTLQTVNSKKQEYDASDAMNIWYLLTDLQVADKTKIENFFSSAVSTARTPQIAESPLSDAKIKAVRYYNSRGQLVFESTGSGFSPKSALSVPRHLRNAMCVMKIITDKGITTKKLYRTK